METPVRIDKWLWAARFFKSRSLARQAVDGGKVHLNGTRVKPARAVQSGDRLDITRGETRYEIVVVSVTARRGPAPVAQTLYQETPESAHRRESEQETKRLQKDTAIGPQRRPDKHGRRRLRDLKR